MNMHLLQGNTWAINFPSAVGIYVFPDNSCLLIDSGASEAFGRRTFKILENWGFQVRALFNTHAHADHCGGNRYLQETTGCEIYASKIEAAFIENPMLIPYGLYSASPIKALKNKYLMPEASRVDFRVEESELFIDNACFRILPLPGHSLGHTGIITPDDVLFAGDSLTSIDILKGFPFLYLADVEKHLETLNTLKSLNIEQVFLAHGGLQDNIVEVIDYNYQILMNLLEYILEVIGQPRGREEILPLMVEEFNLPLNRNQYVLILASLSACLSYLCNTKQAKVYTENNRLLFIQRGQA
ncbi:MAG: MBL fold metallo-hydrolase [Syntrophomonadaceae bacterium]|nr:MBL fold metallo-hydrolase [Syntrophomonadaceae bacterium]